MKDPRVLVFSDYEPDDFLALWMIYKLFNNVVLVVTENQGATLQKKCEDAMYYFPKFTVFKGATSETKYFFKKEAKIPSRRIFQYDFEAMNPPHLVFGLAPPRDIIAVTQQNPNYFKKSRAFFFGGFNFVHLLVLSLVMDLDEWFQTTFKSVVVFEKMDMFGEHFIFHTHSGPLFPALMNMRSVKARRLLKLTTNWDTHMMDTLIGELRAFLNYRHKQIPAFSLPQCAEELLEFMKKDEESSRHDAGWPGAMRKLGILISIMKWEYQMVAADPAVVAFYDEPEDSERLVPVRFRINQQGRFEYVPAETSNMFLFKSSDGAATLAEAEQKIVNLLQ